jgi:hypothetical protein
MYPPRKSREKKTEITTAVYRSGKKPPMCRCGERMRIITVQLIGPVDERTITRRYPGVEVCPRCRLADVSRLSKWDWERVRSYLQHEWIPEELPRDRVEIRER